MQKSAKHKLLILSQHCEIYKQLIEQAGLPGLSVLAVNNLEEAVRSGGECDMLFGEPLLASKAINQLRQVGWVQATWAGVEPMLAAGMRRDYVLTNARNVYGPMMSEYVFGYLLMIEQRILPRWEAQQAKKWDEGPSGKLKGKVLGLLGVGSIGAHLATSAHQFGMVVHGYSRQSDACREVDRYFHGGALEKFAADLDYLVCCLPGTGATKGLVNADLFAALPARTWLVNIGRGSTVDENALVRALGEGSIAGAVLDVFMDEPLPAENPLWTTPNTFITAHIAARNYPPTIAALFIENYKLYIQGKALQYQVSFELGY